MYKLLVYILVWGLPSSSIALGVDLFLGDASTISDDVIFISRILIAFSGILWVFSLFGNPLKQYKPMAKALMETSLWYFLMTVLVFLFGNLPEHYQVLKLLPCAALSSFLLHAITLGMAKFAE